jgi:hypothetical protein
MRRRRVMGVWEPNSRAQHEDHRESSGEQSEGQQYDLRTATP